ncbi:SRPBCC family protein [Adhaeribacter radiodurans]|uniref:SRPBCC family protein n=1 Tax=Adhaeribacter radiodurans TaxID=2745197 RepID=A0A7L7LAC8_9BACT|nr:SRPBCC family protein [Adhaeribacter radiodurans]QMU29505.1 SRPBCC family protein [Adhaeribacter radiodurans]
MADNIIDLTATIKISKSPAKVFAYLSNYTNDSLWRKEINWVKLNTGTIAKETVITEESFLSRRVPNYVSTLQCTDIQNNRLITSETIPGNPFWAKNTRMVEPLPSNFTKVTYQLQFDRNIVKHGLGFNLPKFLVNFYTRSTMKKYLAVLKKNLEK